MKKNYRAYQTMCRDEGFDLLAIYTSPKNCRLTFDASFVTAAGTASEYRNMMNVRSAAEILEQLKLTKTYPSSLVRSRFRGRRGTKAFFLRWFVKAHMLSAAYQPSRISHCVGCCSPRETEASLRNVAIHVI